MSLSLFYPGIHPRYLSYPAREGGMGNGWGGGVFPVEKPRAGKRLRKKKRSMFERSEFCVSRKRADRRGKRLFTGASFLPHFFRRGKKWGIANRKKRLTGSEYRDIIAIEIHLHISGAELPLTTAVEKFRAYLKRKGLKFTPEREAILETLLSLHGHFGVEELHEILRGRGEKISRATIYRTLPLLVESRLIQETLRCTGDTKYERIYGHEHHDHLVCIGCGKIIEFFDERIENLQEEVCRRYEFEPVEHRLGIRGYCRECREKRKG